MMVDVSKSDCTMGDKVIVFGKTAGHTADTITGLIELSTMKLSVLRRTSAKSLVISLIIINGRIVNDSMGAYVADAAVEKMIRVGKISAKSKGRYFWINSWNL